MPAKKGYTPEFKDQAVRFVLEEIEPDEARGTRVTVSHRSCR